MSAQAHIPTEVYIEWLGKTIEIHWNYHALLMVVLWGLVIPIAIIAVRFFKPKPTEFGIEKGTGRFDRKLLWWTIHWTFMYVGVIGSVAAISLATLVSQGFSGSLHAYLGMATVLFAVLQLCSAWLRGSHGGKHGHYSDPDDPSTWGGDHFNMTPQRRWFEAVHKTTGYVAVTCAIGAIISGLAQYWMVEIAALVFTLFILYWLVFIYFQGTEKHYDTYRSVYGNHPQHPYNLRRKGL